jgi:hypothetical protein
MIEGFDGDGEGAASVVARLAGITTDTVAALLDWPGVPQKSSIS